MKEQLAENQDQIGILGMGLTTEISNKEQIGAASQTIQMNGTSPAGLPMSISMTSTTNGLLEALRKSAISQAKSMRQLDQDTAMASVYGGQFESAQLAIDTALNEVANDLVGLDQSTPAIASITPASSVLDRAMVAKGLIVGSGN